MFDESTCPDPDRWSQVFLIGPNMEARVISVSGSALLTSSYFPLPFQEIAEAYDPDCEEVPAVGCLGGGGVGARCSSLLAFI